MQCRVRALTSFPKRGGGTHNKGDEFECDELTAVRLQTGSLVEIVNRETTKTPGEKKATWSNKAESGPSDTKSDAS